jgi:hypothetical protein
MYIIISMIKSRKENIDATFSTHGRDEEFITNFSRKSLREEIVRNMCA